MKKDSKNNEGQPDILEDQVQAVLDSRLPEYLDTVVQEAKYLGRTSGFSGRLPVPPEVDRELAKSIETLSEFKRCVTEIVLQDEVFQDEVRPDLDDLVYHCISRSAMYYFYRHGGGDRIGVEYDNNFFNKFKSAAFPDLNVLLQPVILSFLQAWYHELQLTNLFLESQRE